MPHLTERGKCIKAHPRQVLNQLEEAENRRLREQARLDRPRRMKPRGVETQNGATSWWFFLALAESRETSCGCGVKWRNPRHLTNLPGAHNVG